VSRTSDPDHFDFVRAWFGAFNHGRVDALAAMYVEAARGEDGEGVRDGAAAIADAYARHFAEWDGALDGGARRRVRTIARMENGWIHAEWIARERRRATGETAEATGYDRFLVEQGRIVRQISAATPPPARGPRAADDTPQRSRRYPERPIVGVGAVIVRGDEVVLIRRRFEPLKGQWSLPGGTLELGEMLEAAVAREMFEETGLVDDVGPVIEVFDRITMDDERRVSYHFVLVDYLCRPVGGTLAHGSDVDAAVFVAADRVHEYGVTPKVRAVVARAIAMAREHRWDEIAR
jgi:ADP-ribose pyrophosphatase YjhB (NUDIX family)